MKNEKLELLLNKVVEFNKPDVVYCKGFLYKDNRGYYLKVVEGITGFLSYNDKHWLSEGDEKYIIQADKPKLMRVSLKFNGFLNKITFGLIVAVLVSIGHYAFALMHTLYECLLFVVARQAFKANLQKMMLKI